MTKPSMFEQAAVLAETEVRAAEAVRRRAAEEDARFEAELVAMWDALCVELWTLDGRATRHGTLRVSFDATNTRSARVVCGHRTVLAFRAEVGNFCFQGSDESPVEEYRAPELVALAWSPEYHDNRDGDARWTETASSARDMPALFERLARHLAWWL